MNRVTRRAFMGSVGATALVNAAAGMTRPTEPPAQPTDLTLKGDWWIQSSTLVSASGEAISRPGFRSAGWYQTELPRTVLSALVMKNGVYPDPRWGLNAYRIPDSSDEFNRKFDLAKYSRLPDKRNPWRDACCYRTEFTVPETMRGKRLWLIFKGINFGPMCGSTVTNWPTGKPWSGCTGASFSTEDRPNRAGMAWQ